MQRLKNFGYKKTAGILTLLVFALSLPLTLTLLSQRQELRQRAERPHEEERQCYICQNFTYKGPCPEGSYPFTAPGTSELKCRGPHTNAFCPSPCNGQTTELCHSEENIAGQPCNIDNITPIRVPTLTSIPTPSSIITPFSTPTGPGPTLIPTSTSFPTPTLIPTLTSSPAPTPISTPTPPSDFCSSDADCPPGYYCPIQPCPTGASCDFVCQPIVTPTLSPSPTRHPTPIPTPAYVSALISLKLPGIGIDGTVNPLHPMRSARILVFNTQNQQVKDAVVNVEFDGVVFKEVIFLNGVTQGIYYFKIKLENTLRKLVPGNHSLFPQSPTILPTITLIPGDLDDNNTLNIFDYNLFIYCFGENPCAQKTLSDFNDDGSVDGVDYNILIRSFATQQGD